MNKRILRKFNVLAAVPILFALAALIIAPTNALAEEKCVDLLAGDGTAGQNTVAGSVCSKVVDRNLVVTYTTVDEWELDAYHLWAGSDLDDMPQNKFGSPKLGRFPYKEIGLSGGETPFTTVTVTVTPAELGVSTLCDVSDVIVVAHAVVARDSDSDGTLDTFPTGFGNGFELEGNSWALGMNVQLCEVPSSFNAAGLEADLVDAAAGGAHDGAITMGPIQYFSGNSSEPYLRGNLTDGAGTEIKLGTDLYCIDLAHNISPGGTYCALLFSSYDPAVALLDGDNGGAGNGVPDIAHPENLDLVNYVMNNYAIGDTMNDNTTLTGGSIQETFWRLIYTGVFGTDVGNHGEGATSEAHIQEMIASAVLSGEGYEPPCTGA